MGPVCKFFTLAFFLTLLAATSLQASITGSISGVVSNSSGAVVSGATVVAKNIQTRPRSRRTPKASTISPPYRLEPTRSRCKGLPLPKYSHS